MHVADSKLWKLTYSELAHFCQELGHSTSVELDPQIRDEARRLHSAWSDALAINTHEEGGAERQASMALGLRKRTIELALKSGSADE